MGTCCRRRLIDQDGNTCSRWYRLDEAMSVILWSVKIGLCVSIFLFTVSGQSERTPGPQTPQCVPTDMTGVGHGVSISVAERVEQSITCLNIYIQVSTSTMEESMRIEKTRRLSSDLNGKTESQSYTVEGDVRDLSGVIKRVRSKAASLSTTFARDLASGHLQRLHRKVILDGAMIEAIITSGDLRMVMEFNCNVLMGSRTDKLREFENESAEKTCKAWNQLLESLANVAVPIHNGRKREGIGR